LAGYKDWDHPSGASLETQESAAPPFAAAALDAPILASSSLATVAVGSAGTASTAFVAAGLQLSSFH